MLCAVCVALAHPPLLLKTSSVHLLFGCDFSLLVATGKKWQGKRGWRCSDCIMVADWLVYCSQLNSTTELWDFLLSPAKPFINRPQQRITPSNFIVVSDLCGGWKIAATNCIGWRRLRRSLHNWESIFISLCVGVDRMRMYIYSRYSSAGAPCKDG